MEDLRNSINASSEIQDIRSQLIQAQGQMSKMHSEEEVRDIAKNAYLMGIHGLSLGEFAKWLTHFKKQ